MLNEKSKSGMLKLMLFHGKRSATKLHSVLSNVGEKKMQDSITHFYYIFNPFHKIRI